MVIVQIAIIFLFLAIGEVIVWATGIPIPSSIIGMLCLTAALQYKVIKLRWVSGVAEFLTSNLGFFFIPAGVSLMHYFDIFARPVDAHSSRLHSKHPRCPMGNRPGSPILKKTYFTPCHYYKTVAY